MLVSRDGAAVWCLGHHKYLQNLESWQIFNYLPVFLQGFQKGELFSDVQIRCDQLKYFTFYQMLFSPV